MSEFAKRALVNNEVKRLILVGATRIQDSDGLRLVFTCPLADDSLNHHGKPMGFHSP